MNGSFIDIEATGIRVLVFHSFSMYSLVVIQSLSHVQLFARPLGGGWAGQRQGPGQAAFVVPRHLSGNTTT